MPTEKPNQQKRDLAINYVKYKLNLIGEIPR